MNGEQMMTKQEQDDKLVSASVNLLPNEFIQLYLADNTIEYNDQRLSDKIMNVIDRHYEDMVDYREVAHTINHVKGLVIQGMFLGVSRQHMNEMREELK